jgi:hypothetical protein
MYIVQATRNGTGLPTFFLSGDVQGILTPEAAARVALDILTPHGSTLTFLRETMTGTLEAVVTGVREVGEHSYATGDVTYHVHAAVADDVLTTSESPTVALRQRLDRLYTEDAPRHETERVYAAELEAHSVAYAVAADAPGLRKDAARYLLAESIRLPREAGLHIDRADILEQASTGRTRQAVTA